MFFVFIAEIIILVMCFQEWGFIDTLGVYLMPSILGAVVVSMSGASSLVRIQSTLSSGGAPDRKMLHRVAIFIGGLFLIVPMWTARLIGAILILPGLRHLALGRMQKILVQKMTTSFQQGFQSGPFGFKYYRYTGKTENPFGSQNQDSERDVSPSHDVLDVTPIKISHEEKKD